MPKVLDKASKVLVPAVETPRRKPPNAGKGRVKGVPNKVTQEFRVTVQRLLDDNRENVALWLRQVAEGTPDKLNAKGQVIMAGRPADPAGALTRLGHLADFAAPKLSRQEQVGEGGGPLTVVIRKEA
jgi:hypothetical protein